jgi:hypothetical protein
MASGEHILDWERGGGEVKSGHKAKAWPGTCESLSTEVEGVWYGSWTLEVEVSNSMVH